MLDRLNRALRRLPTWPFYVAGLAPALFWFTAALQNRIGADPIKALEHELGLLVGGVGVAEDVIAGGDELAEQRLLADDAGVVQVDDLMNAPLEEYPLGRELARKYGHRTILGVPLMRERTVLGCILLRRREVRPFTEKQIALVRTFADQAAIAIENVRLFNETKESLERQTATAEILQVIASSPSNVLAVFESIC
jgi:GAF domain-containing protein